MLIFHLKKKWFEKIKTGEKTHEYREVGYYWLTRLRKYVNNIDWHNNFSQKTYFTCLFCLGYPSNNDYSGKRILAVVKKISVVDGKNTDLQYDGKVFDIEFELLEEQK